ncbi:DNA cytosine methyltransferase [Breoghania sp.]|uniref:DNA cytosine methyltransferase n=1 Tax=Breoghania sp. TaxID=2065378 RepID=UPI002AA825EA|nr:DNA cytosine methyltransferase [Breoghania sp.]
MAAYYNEVDPYAADWLENLIADGLICPGDVDRRDVRDVHPADLAGYTQCHLYAGIGVWSYSLRLAGWPDARPVWTFSEPCQPFSAAGRRKGASDERYLRPYTHHLVSICRPAVCFGEQVASKDGLAWLDTLQTDMEGEGYAVGAVDTCSAGVGAPHIRQRLRFVAQRLAPSDSRELDRFTDCEGRERNGKATGRNESDSQLAASRDLCGMADMHSDGRDEMRERLPASGHDGIVGNRAIGGMGDGERARLERHAGHVEDGHEPGRLDTQPHGPATASGAACRLADAAGGGCEPRAGDARLRHADTRPSYATVECGALQSIDPRLPGPVNGVWRDADWLYCRDDKWRPVEPGTFPLVDGAAFKLGSGSAYAGKSRAGMLKGYGNAIDAQATAEFIRAVMESLP